MTLVEFKAWLEGFSEAIADVPTKEQWEKIKDRLSQAYGPVVPSTPPNNNRLHMPHPLMGQAHIQN